MCWMFVLWMLMQTFSQLSVSKIQQVTEVKLHSDGCRWTDDTHTHTPEFERSITHTQTVYKHTTKHTCPHTAGVCVYSAYCWPWSLSPPAASPVSSEQLVLRGRHWQSRWCGSTWTLSSGRTRREPGGSTGAQSSGTTGGCSETQREEESVSLLIHTV